MKIRNNEVKEEKEARIYLNVITGPDKKRNVIQICHTKKTRK